MNLPELSVPIRIYWDITPLPDSPPDLGKIAADIIDSKILSVDISATGNSIPLDCFDVIALFVHSRIGVTLTISPTTFSATVEQLLATTPPKELLFEITSVTELRLLLPFNSAVAGISFPLSSNNWQDIPAVIRCCEEYGLKRIVFPLQRLYNGEIPFHVPKHGLEQTAAAVAAHQLASDMHITVHDPFVWRAIFPQTPFPEGRCQAANTMLSIDSNGTVYPCPVMPVPLGNLGTSSLKEITKSSAKKEQRAQLLRLPRGCVECAAAESCKGGCRGRSERIFGTWDGIDPGCR